MEFTNGWCICIINYKISLAILKKLVYYYKRRTKFESKRYAHLKKARKERDYNEKNSKVFYNFTYNFY